MQRRKLRQVHWSRIRPGDVVWRPGHVGMYVGHGWAIHAPGKGKQVQFQPVNRFKSAHRPE
jgi:peptidoglycan DL-endopeptidase CwlO